MVAGGHYDRGDNQNEIAAEEKKPCPAADAFPLVEKDTPNTAADNNQGRLD